MQNLEPKTVWENFHKLTQVPRPSGHVAAVSQMVAEYGRSLGLETIVEPIGNVIIRKPATPGYESHPGVILQGHLDMVPQADDKNFDFTTMPIETHIEDGWVLANHTTLGADNGIGVATAMAILADNTLKHPAIEAFFTVDEETGMFGAEALEAGVLKGHTLLNLDCEAEGELYIGCAGGVDAEATFAYEPVPVAEGDIAMQIDLTGLKGGHSGCDIHLQRANANKLMASVVRDLVMNFEARLASFDGGNMRNAIPRDAHVVVTIPAESKEDVEQAIMDWEDDFIRKFDGVENNITLTCHQVECPAEEMPEDVQDYLIHALTICPSGVYRVIPEMPETVETSNNLAIVETRPDHTVHVFCLTRSNVESRKEELQEIIESTFMLAGATVEFSGAYPGWKPNVKSNILSKMKEVYKSMFGTEPKVSTIHAGLECGIIGRNYPGMDMISFGPTIEHPHSPEERVNIETVQKFYQLTLATLEAL